MRIYARKYKWYKDLFFQCHILRDKAIQQIMFDNKRGVLKYFLPWTYHCKYIAIMENDGKTKRFSITTFRKDSEKGGYWIAGFVPAKMQNKGLGIYAGITFINEFFKTHPEATILSASRAANVRAFRTTLSMGFQCDVQDNRHFESSLTREQFDNDFVHYMMKRGGIE